MLIARKQDHVFFTEYTIYVIVFSLFAFILFTPTKQLTLAGLTSPTRQEASFILFESVQTQQLLQFQTVVTLTLEPSIAFCQPSASTRLSEDRHRPSSALLARPSTSAGNNLHSTPAISNSQQCVSAFQVSQHWNF